MKTLIATLSLALVGLSFVATPTDADAKRLGGGKPAGMQRQMPAKPADATPNTPVQPATPPTNNAAAAPVAGAAPAAAAAPQAGKRSWMGPIAGLAAGLGIAALLSHFGLGEAFSNIMMMALLAFAAVFVVGWLMRRFGGRASSPALAGAGVGAGAGSFPGSPPSNSAMERSNLAAAGIGGGATTQPSAAMQLPKDFDAAAFERIAKMIFIRLQTANDDANLEDLRKFTTPELFASLRVDLQERGGVAQKTDVVQLNAHVVDAAQEPNQWVVTVRFTGLVREQSESGADAIDELWHMVRPVDGSRDWAIAGITPTAG